MEIHAAVDSNTNWAVHAAMSDELNKKTDWPVVLFLLVGLPVAFTYGGIWVGLITLIVGVIALGWGKRHEGPFPTKGPGR